MLRDEHMDQATGLRSIRQHHQAKVIAVAAGKGGVGKSNISVNLSVGLSRLGKKVLLMDADLGLANVDIMLGLHARHNLSHVLKGDCTLQDIILTGPEGVKIIPAASGIEAMTQLSPMEHAGIIDAFNELTDDLDYVIIDTAAGISDTVLSFARSAQDVLVVVCDEPTSLTDAYAFIKVMSRRYERDRFYVVANMVRSLKDGEDLFARLDKVAEQFLQVQLFHVATIPFDERIHDSVKKQKPVILSYPETPAALALNGLIHQVEQWPKAKSLDGNTSFFIERLANALV